MAKEAAEKAAATKILASQEAAKKTLGPSDIGAIEKLSLGEELAKVLPKVSDMKHIDPKISPRSKAINRHMNENYSPWKLDEMSSDEYSALIDNAGSLYDKYGKTLSPARKDKLTSVLEGLEASGEINPAEVRALKKLRPSSSKPNGNFEIPF